MKRRERKIGVVCVCDIWFFSCLPLVLLQHQQDDQENLLFASVLASDLSVACFFLRFQSAVQDHSLLHLFHHRLVVWFHQTRRKSSFDRYSFQPLR